MDFSQKTSHQKGHLHVFRSLARLGVITGAVNKLKPSSRDLDPQFNVLLF